MIEEKEIKLKDIAVAIGAPMKPRRIDSGPHTGWSVNGGIKKKKKRTKKVIE